jgi:hypothetical protein
MEVVRKMCQGEEVMLMNLELSIIICPLRRTQLSAKYRGVSSYS